MTPQPPTIPPCDLDQDNTHRPGVLQVAAIPPGVIAYDENTIFMRVCTACLYDVSHQLKLGKYVMIRVTAPEQPQPVPHTDRR